MVSTTSKLPREGEIDPITLEAWLERMSAPRPEGTRERLSQALDLLRECCEAQPVSPDPLGRPLFLPLIHTADILADLKLDADSLIAALLSEAPACTELGADIMARQFGPAVEHLVSDLAKLEAPIRGGSLNAGPGHFENLRRLLLGLVKDVRALLIVLARRLELMRVLKRLPEEQQRRIALETREVHAPLANRLGIWQLKWELEDLSLRFSEPKTYKQITSQLEARRTERETLIINAIAALRRGCEAQGIKVEISGRPKHIYSIWRKMQRKKVDFDQIFDVHALRVFTDTLPHCYEVLGLVHSQWQPIRSEFDDYIARPKPNGYQSLHTAVVGEDGKPLEVQIRTREMHEQAERGVAAHWRYKEQVSSDAELDRRIESLRQWLEAPSETPIEEEPDDEPAAPGRIYVRTPTGEVIELPAGATPIDFAYAIHTQVGHRCRGAKINGQIASLKQPLASGQTVEIKTTKQGGPSRDWLNTHEHYVTTSRARNRIRQWWKQQDFDEHVQQGKAALERELTRQHLPKPSLDKAPARFNLNGLDDLFAAIGRGEISASQVIGLTQPRPPKPKRPRGRKPNAKHSNAGVVVEGVDDLLTHMAKCCKPVPFDPIVGFITRGRGVTVHRRDCKVINKLSPDDQARMIDVAWADDEQLGAFVVDIQVHAYDRKGLLRDLSGVFADAEILVLGTKTQTDRHRERADLRFTVEVEDVRELSRVIGQLNQTEGVLDVRRQV